MKSILCHIAVAVSLVLASCTGGGVDEPDLPEWLPGKAPLSFRSLHQQSSRADYASLDGTAYDIYLSAAIEDEEDGYADVYYTYRKMNGIITIFQPMIYDVENSLFYLQRFFYPMSGNIYLYTYGVEHGKNIVPLMTPETIDPVEGPECMALDLTKGYDGSFDIIAADRMVVECNMELQPDSLPYGHYHHIMSHIDIKLAWADDVAASSAIIPRIAINSVTLKDASYEGIFHCSDKVADGTWTDIGDDAVIQNKAANKGIPYGSSLNLGGAYIIPSKRNDFIVNYTMRNGTSDKPTYTTMHYVVGDDHKQDWLPGHKYTYTITIGDKGHIQISNVAVERFADGNVGDTEIK